MLSASSAGLLEFQQISTHESDEARVLPYVRQIGVAQHVFQVAVAEFERRVERRDRGVIHVQQRIAAREIVVGQRVIRPKPNQSPVGCESAGIESFGGEVARVNPEYGHVVGISLEDSFEEIEFKIELRSAVAAAR